MAYWNRIRAQDIMDTLDSIMEEMERDFELVLRGALDSQEKFEKPLYYGFSVQIGDDGHPVIQTYGNTGLSEEGTREPIYEEILDPTKGQTRLVIELPGIEKEDLTNFWITLANEILSSTSMKAEGSSKKYTSASVSRQAETATFCSSPPLRDATFLSNNLFRESGLTISDCTNPDSRLPPEAALSKLRTSPS